MTEPMGCLYALTFPSGKKYIGITAGTLRRRLNLHRSHANRGRPGAVYNAIRKYGTNGFIAEILVRATDWDYLCELEKKAIKAFKTRAPYGYNLTDGGEGAQGQVYTPEQRKKMSEGRKGKGTGPRPDLRGWKHTAEAKAKISEAGKGRIFSEERRAKIGATKIGNKYNVGSKRSPESRTRMSEWQKGKPKSADTVKKMADSKRGIKRGPHSLATRTKMSEAAKRRGISEECRAKISATKRGKPWSDARKIAQKYRYKNDV